MKRILFIIPWSGFYIGNADSCFRDDPERAPEGVVGLATYLRAKGAEVRIADMQQMLRACKGEAQTALEGLWNICLEFAPHVIGFSFFTARLQFAAQIHSFLYSRYGGSAGHRPLIIAGGVHPTLLPLNTLGHIPFDAVIVGEGEIPLTKLLNGEGMETIKGFCTPNGKATQKADLVDNLDDIPFPDWTLVDKDFYTQPSYQISNAETHRVMPITFGRGCMYRCNFCAHNCFLKARCHSADYFVEKMNHVSRQCNVDTFIIQDSSIGNFRAIWQDVCRKLIARGTPYKWWANLRANQADEDFLELIKRAGCIKLFFGFESGSQRMLDKMNKRITVEQCRNAALMCHKIGIPFYTSYIVNYFGEREEDLQLTEQLIKETRPTSLAINKFSPVPGSIDYDGNAEMIEQHVNSISDWTMLGMLNFPLHFGDMPQERFDYWYKHLRGLKKYINSHETAPGK